MTEPPDLSAYQAALLRGYCGMLGLAEEAEILPVSFPPLGEHLSLTTLVARIAVPLEDGPPLWFHGTLGDALVERAEAPAHEHQFVGIYELAVPELVQLVAACRHFHQAIARLDTDHTFPLAAESALRRRGYGYGLVLHADLYADVIPGFAGGTSRSFGGTRTRVLSVLPIDAADWQLKVDHGVDALLARWEQMRRDPFTVEPVSE